MNPFKKYAAVVRTYPLFLAIVHFNAGVAAGLIYALFI